MTEQLSDSHPYLYHYTNVQGLKGILENQCLWATHYKFLNDSSEFQLFKQYLEKLLYPSRLRFYTKEYIENLDSKAALDSVGGLQAAAKRGVEDFLKIIYEKIPHEIFIVSFCAEHKDEYTKEHGLLSQWRGYGENGGYAIVFKTESLMEMLKVESELFQYNFLYAADVIYNDEEGAKKLEEELTEEIRQNISNFQLEIIKGAMQGKQEFPDNQLAEKALTPAFQFGSRYKHQGFKEENEVRIIAIHFPIKEEQHGKQEKQRLFRNNNGVLVPYIEIFKPKIRNLPIEKIIVGPHREKELRAEALRIMLKDSDIVDKVMVSDIP